jgi:hypothetical protein
MHDLHLQNSFNICEASSPNSWHIKLRPPVDILAPLGKNWMQSQARQIEEITIFA